MFFSHATLKGFHKRLSHLNLHVWILSLVKCRVMGEYFSVCCFFLFWKYITIYSNKTTAKYGVAYTRVNSLDETEQIKHRYQTMCSWRVMIVNLWCHKCFCSTLVRMLWLRISLYSDWMFYGKYPFNLLFWYICKYDYFPNTQGHTLIESNNKYVSRATTWIYNIVLIIKYFVALRRTAGFSLVQALNCNWWKSLKAKATRCPCLQHERKICCL